MTKKELFVVKGKNGVIKALHLNVNKNHYVTTKGYKAAIAAVGVIDRLQNLEAELFAYTGKIETLQRAVNFMSGVDNS